PGPLVLEVWAVGYERTRESFELSSNGIQGLRLTLQPVDSELKEVVVSGTLKAVSRADSPIPVELYSSTFLRKNNGPSLMEALGNIGGIRTQNNCNICSTGDIHINGMEGAYTLVLIDGMPMVSSLGSVYGLFGIPKSLIDRVEIVRGPASALYGSESMGGLINVITKRPDKAPRFSVDWSGNTWLENQLDVGGTFRVSKSWDVLTGIHHYGFNQPIDRNHDGFTDLTQQSRYSVFQKWQMKRPSSRLFTLSGRYLYENRWGGDVRWTNEDRGKETFYGESIYTHRIEFLGAYQLPIRELIQLQWSFVDHLQDSYYGTTPFMGRQRVGFVQMTWDKKVEHWDGLLGLANRYTYYDDNTIVTSMADCPMINAPSRFHLPGLFAQTEWIKHKEFRALGGVRLDYHSVHGPIVTPRLAVKWKPSDQHIVRFNAGSGFRVINVFSEDHAALTGARRVVVADNLLPERSINTSLDYQWTKSWQGDRRLSINGNLFYTHFLNRIVPDYMTDANTLIYDNLNGYATNKGFHLSADGMLGCRWKFNASMTLSDQTLHEHQEGQWVSSRPLLSERFSGAWTVTYAFKQIPISIDYTGNVVGPMLLPTLGPLDPRPTASPWWSIQNIQITYKPTNRWEFFVGVKNLLNWTPAKNLPFLIARPNDPFDKQVEFDAQGRPVPNSDNPYGLTFDPTYAYAPNQGIRMLIGLRYQWM
ncbi:MAG: hypothetical protein RLZZ262_553, partial [Bacteroidota bacterium]